MHKTNNHRIILIALAAVLGACGKTRYGAGCKKATEITSPWSSLGLPIDEKKTRVCESTSDALKLRSYVWSTKQAAQDAVGAALSAQGWTEDRCSEQACYYDKDGYQISVQPAEFKLERKQLITVMMRHRKDPTQK